MDIAPVFKECKSYPVTFTTSFLAVIVTIAFWSEVDLSWLFANGNIRRGELWRLVTSVFIHGDITHLLFNIYWIWLFGTAVEKIYGSKATLALMLLFAAGSSAWEFALSLGGIGLSGVVYGLFGMVFVLRTRDERFKGVVDKTTVLLLFGWFFICIAIGMKEYFGVIFGGKFIAIAVVVLIGLLNIVSPIRKNSISSYRPGLWFLLMLAVSVLAMHGKTAANAAHAGGLVLGLLVGHALAKPRYPVLAQGLIAITLLSGLAGATIMRPYVNFTPEAGWYERYWCSLALTAERNDEALKWCRDAAQYDLTNYDSLVNLAIAFERNGDKNKARYYFEQAKQRDPERYAAETKPEK